MVGPLCAAYEARWAGMTLGPHGAAPAWEDLRPDGRAVWQAVADAVRAAAPPAGDVAWLLQHALDVIQAASRRIESLTAEIDRLDSEHSAAMGSLMAAGVTEAELQRRIQQLMDERTDALAILEVDQDEDRRACDIALRADAAVKAASATVIIQRVKIAWHERLQAGARARGPLREGSRVAARAARDGRGGAGCRQGRGDQPCPGMSGRKYYPTTPARSARQPR